MYLTECILLTVDPLVLFKLMSCSKITFQWFTLYDRSGDNHCGQ